MNCPYCHVEIGGHVEVGTQAYYRVSKGQCPSCGREMPPGYTIDFLSPSGRLMSEEKTLRENKEFMDSVSLMEAPDNYKKIRFHTAFGASGLFMLLYLLLTVIDGVIVLEFRPLLFSFIASLIFWIVPQSISLWHYKNFVKDQNSVKSARANCEMRSLVVCISWLIFIFSSLFLLGVVV